jgi:dihydroorotate dehydrogenase (fumarate)
MAGLPPSIAISPPLLNSANPWATTLQDLRALFACSSTGAVTTRTSLLIGFGHDSEKHQYTFFDPITQAPSEDSSAAQTGERASLNTLGYSPLPLSRYLSFVHTISDELLEPSKKLFIISVTGSPKEVAECYCLIAKEASSVKLPLAVEINLSCPNIPGAPPPAYSGKSLSEYLEQLRSMCSMEDIPRLPFGLKTPPYTHAGQFETLVSAMRTAGSPSPVSFITATNTLGSCLVLSDRDGQSAEPQLAGLGIGGMAGTPLHPIALGNVATLRRMLDETEETRHVSIIGVGGVEDASGYRRMKSVGATAVGVATALGRKGIKIFEDIGSELGSGW